jgi:hypothetical protein
MRWALAVGLLLTATACGSPRHVVISQDGRIGPLRMDRSTRADVISLAGKPDAERKGVEYDSTPYVAIGYGCSASLGDDAFPLLEIPGKGRVGPDCRTVFWINRRTSRLGDFYTVSRRYTESHGVRIGMGTATAERLLQEKASVGCGGQFFPASGEEPSRSPSTVAPS